MKTLINIMKELWQCLSSIAHHLRFFLLLYVLILILSAPFSAWTLEPERVQLTPEEKVWLAKHKNIRLGVDPAWPPFEFFDATQLYAGIASDYVQFLNRRLNLNMVPVRDLTWSEVMEKTKAGAIDVLPCVAKTPERLKFLLFTKPYLSFSMVILTREDAPFINGVQDFEDGKVAVVKGYFSHEMLQQDYPNRKFYLTNDIEEALNALSKGRVDAFVGNLASITYTTQRLGLTNLKVSTPTPYTYDLGFAVRKDWPQLVNILNKGLLSIPDSEKMKSHNHWINVRFEKRTDWGFIWRASIVAAVVIGLILAVIIRWNRKLAKEVTERKKTEEALRQSEASARGLLDATQESLFLLDTSGRVIAANQTAAQRLQKRPEELNGMNLFSLLPPAIRESRRANFDKAIRTGIPEEFEDIRDGTVFQSRYFPVQDKLGSVIGAAIFAQDITERKRAEGELRENMEELERFSKLAVGREERMIELKEEINELLRNIGQSDKYKIVT